MDLFSLAHPLHDPGLLLRDKQHRGVEGRGLAPLERGLGLHHHHALSLGSHGAEQTLLRVLLSSGNKTKYFRLRRLDERELRRELRQSQDRSKTELRQLRES